MTNPAAAMTELITTGVLAPQVAAMRIINMIAAGPQPNLREQRAMYEMGAEKVLAFTQSWWQMSQQMALLQCRVCLGMAAPRLYEVPSASRAVGQLISAGSKPISRKVRANHRRLTSSASRKR